MPFTYADAPHVRKHGPGGYEMYQSYKAWLRDEFTFRCVYCLERERWYPNGHAGFGVDHVKPKGQPEYVHLACHYPNLVYACNRCNTAKDGSLLLDPCEVAFGAHLRQARMIASEPTPIASAALLTWPAITPRTSSRNCGRKVSAFTGNPSSLGN